MVLFIAILGVINFAFKAAGQNLNTQIAPMMCMDRSFFRETIGTKQSIYLLGTMPGSNHLLEVWRNDKLNWTILFRSSYSEEICIVASGNQLILTDWFEEKNLPQ
jgi:hypothetical protein